MESSKDSQGAKKSDGCLGYVFFYFFAFLAGYPLGELARYWPWAPFALLLLGAACWAGYFSRGQEKWVFPAPGKGICISLIFCGFCCWVLQYEELQDFATDCPSYDLAEIEKNPRNSGLYNQSFPRDRFGLSGSMMALYPLSREIGIGKDGRGYAYPLVSRSHPLYQSCLQGKVLQSSDSRLLLTVWVLGGRGDARRKPEIVVGPLWLRLERLSRSVYEVVPDPFAGARSRFFLACLLMGLGLMGLVLVPVGQRLRGRVEAPPPSLPPLRDS